MYQHWTTSAVLKLSTEFDDIVKTAKVWEDLMDKGGLDQNPEINE